MNRYKIEPGQKIKLEDFDPDETHEFDGKKSQAQEPTAKLNQELEILQERLYAEHKHKLLVVLQGMDTSGKDGTIRHVFEGVNPQGVRVASFKVPTPEEMDHDYLWRVHKQAPGKGEIVIFNRSHYEDVLVPAVNGWITPAQVKQRYEQINQFERLLTETGTVVCKFMLHISKEEQRVRLQERLDEIGRASCRERV